MFGQGRTCGWKEIDGHKSQPSPSDVNSCSLNHWLHSYKYNHPLTTCVPLEKEGEGKQTGTVVSNLQNLYHKNEGIPIYKSIYIYIYTTFGGRRVPDAIIHPDFMFSDKHCRKFTRHLKTGKVCVHRRHPFLKGAIAVTPPKTNISPQKYNRCKDDFPFSGWSYFQGFFTRVFW